MENTGSINAREPFDWDDKPTGIAWVNGLGASQAIAQCAKWGLVPAPTLEENRVTLKNVIKLASSRPSAGLVGDGKSSEGASEDRAQWMRIVQTTAQEVGQQVALALAGRDRGRQTEAVAITPPPRVVQDLATTAPTCTGADAPSLLTFMKIHQQAVSLRLATDQQVMAAFLAKTAGQLRAVWVEALQRDTPADQLITQIVNVFLPDRARQQLISRAIYRPQGLAEPLPDFVMDVRDSARILMPEVSDLLEIVLTGINADTRATMAGFPSPANIEELLALGPRLEVVRQMNEQSRARGSDQGQQRASARPWGANRPIYDHARASTRGSNRCPQGYSDGPRFGGYGPNRPNREFFHNNTGGVAPRPREYQQGGPHRGSLNASRGRQ